MSGRARLAKPDGLRITKLERHPDGYWTANASLNGTTVRVDDSCGSWLAPDGRGPARSARAGSFVLPPVAAELSRQVRRLEKREARVNGVGGSV